jgi:hypothetical protein
MKATSGSRIFLIAERCCHTLVESGILCGPFTGNCLESSTVNIVEKDACVNYYFNKLKILADKKP